MDKTLIKLKALRDAFEGEGFDASCQMLDEIIEEVGAYKCDEWVSVEDNLPNDGDNVLFIVEAKDWQLMSYLNGKIFGGTFHYSGGMPTFSVPGTSFSASKWKSITPPTPEKDTREALDKLTVTTKRN